MSTARRSLRTVFVGGPGRSGTTVVAQRIAAADGAVAFPGVELKFFTEKNGILDLWHSLGEHYSPNRAVVAMRQFRRFACDLIDGRFSQPGFSTLAPAADWHRLFDAFTTAFEDSGHPGPVTATRFEAAARDLVRGLHRLALARPGASTAPLIFIDNTPHSVLENRFLARLFPEAAFLHVMRDPRSIARSLRSMSWGPSTLAECCSWVDSYCRAWATQIPSERVDLQAVHIEDLAADPRRTGAQIGAWLGIGDLGGFFAYTDPQTLNSWVPAANPGDLSLLNRRLAGWTEYFGYSPDTIGCRPEGASGGRAARPGSPAGSVESAAAGT